VRVEAEAIVSLDPIFVDNSQTSKRFKAVREVFSENKFNGVSVYHQSNMA
jgi:hypothetical protein